jgi:hypothetical protein
MTDVEIGGGKGPAIGARPWDGIPGPRLSADNETLRFPNIFYADYTVSARQGLFTTKLTAKVGTREYIDRIRAMHLVNQFFKLNPDRGVLGVNRMLLSFEEGRTNYAFVCASIHDTRKDTSGSGAHRFFVAKVEGPFTLLVDKSTLVVTPHDGVVAADADHGPVMHLSMAH